MFHINQKSTIQLLNKRHIVNKLCGLLYYHTGFCNTSAMHMSAQGSISSTGAHTQTGIFIHIFTRVQKRIPWGYCNTTKFIQFVYASKLVCVCVFSCVWWRETQWETEWERARVAVVVYQWEMQCNVKHVVIVERNIYRRRRQSSREFMKGWLSKWTFFSILIGSPSAHFAYLSCFINGSRDYISSSTLALLQICNNTFW